MLNISDISNQDLRKMAYESGFMKRRSKKIDPPFFLANLCLSVLEGSPSYNDLAARFQAEYKISASKQAFWKRADASCVCFLKSILARIIIQKVNKLDSLAIKACMHYNRVIVQDSTIIKLPLRLFDVFSGVSNGNAAVCNARIQGVYDLLSGCFLSFSIDPYSKNDKSAAPELEMQKGDLILRDRGYSTNDEIRRHIKSGADCIYRHKSSSVYLEPDTYKNINLVDLLVEREELDMQVCLNDKERTKIRLVAKPVSAEIANLRRMKAKKDMRGHNPSPEILFLMSWTIYITTISHAQADFQRILLIYKLRWRIEIIFKIFKSHMSFSKVHNVSEHQLSILLTARFIMIVLCIHFIYQPSQLIIANIYNRQLSMIKFMHYLMYNNLQMIHILNHGSNLNYCIMLNLNSIVRYCTYDKRKRQNFNELLNQLLLS
ncbi:MAG: IS4 family transposase [Alphaproteobacteria bacterium]|nr:MAG: IS4 family transposase [Alphaproteobacteria bacterium]